VYLFCFHDNTVSSASSCRRSTGPWQLLKDTFQSCWSSANVCVRVQVSKPHNISQDPPKHAVLPLQQVAAVTLLQLARHIRQHAAELDKLKPSAVEQLMAICECAHVSGALLLLPACNHASCRNWWCPTVLQRHPCGSSTHGAASPQHCLGTLRFHNR